MEAESLAGAAGDCEAGVSGGGSWQRADGAAAQKTPARLQNASANLAPETRRADNPMNPPSFI
jgi:hypothetical protein